MGTRATETDPGARLARLRRARLVGALLVLAGGVGLLSFVLSSGEEEAVPAPTPSAVADSGAAPAPESGAARAIVARPTAASAPKRTGAGRRRPLRVRVSGPGGLEAGVLVRAVETDPAARAQRDCGSTATTDASGLALVEVDDPAPAGALLELARAEHGLRHALVPLDPSVPEPVPAFLPAGGRLSIVVHGAPEGTRLPAAGVKIFPPYGEHLSLFPGMTALPAADGGLQECNAVPRGWRFPFDDQGRATVLHVPDDHAVLVELDVPADRIVESATYDGPRIESADGDVLRVPPGADAVYAVSLREPPAARVRVTDDGGRPIAGARVAAGLRRGGSGTRILSHAQTTDAEGRASVPLWSGPRLPPWAPEGTAVVASAPGRAAVVVEAKAGWYGIEADVVLASPAAGRFGVEGALTFENGKPAAGVPLLLATAAPWNGHLALEPLEGVTDAEGRFRIEVPESLRAVLAYGGGGLRLAVDGARLEEQPRDALWRAVWPSLPRASIRPEALPLPVAGAIARADGVVVLP